MSTQRPQDDAHELYQAALIAAIFDVNDAAAPVVAAARKEALLLRLDDMLMRTDVDRSVLEHLDRMRRKAAAMDDEAFEHL